GQGLLPCVVIAGGREAPHWEAYPGHRFLHSVGSLSCCRAGGCWRSRTRPLGDGSDHDLPERLCVDVAGELPRCMHQITASDVIGHIEKFLSGNRLPILSRVDARRARRAVTTMDNGEFAAL